MELIIKAVTDRNYCVVDENGATWYAISIPELRVTVFYIGDIDVCAGCWDKIIRVHDPECIIKYLEYIKRPEEFPVGSA